VIQADAIVQSDIEQGLFFAVIFIGQLAVLECDRLAFRQKRYLNRVLVWRIDSRRSRVLGFLIHKSLL